MRGKGAIRTACLRRGSGHQSCDHRIPVQAGPQRYCGEDTPRDPPAQGRGQVAHGVVQENSIGHNPRACRKLRSLVEKSKGSRLSAAKRLVAVRDESTRTLRAIAVSLQ